MKYGLKLSPSSTRDLFSDDDFIGNKYDEKDFLENIKIAGEDRPILVYPKGICDGDYCSEPFLLIKVDSLDRSYVIKISNTKELEAQSKKVLKSIVFF